MIIDPWSFAEQHPNSSKTLLIVSRSSQRHALKKANGKYNRTTIHLDYVLNSRKIILRNKRNKSQEVPNF